MSEWFEGFLIFLGCLVAALVIAIVALTLLVFYAIRWVVQTIRRRRAARFGAHTEVALALVADRSDAEVLAEYERELADVLPDFRTPPGAIADSYVSPEDLRPWN